MVLGIYQATCLYHITNFGPKFIKIIILVGIVSHVILFCHSFIAITIVCHFTSFKGFTLKGLDFTNALS